MVSRGYHLVFCIPLHAGYTFTIYGAFVSESMRLLCYATYFCDTGLQPSMRLQPQPHAVRYHPAFIVTFDVATAFFGKVAMHFITCIASRRIDLSGLTCWIAAEPPNCVHDAAESNTQTEWLTITTLPGRA